MEKSGRINLRVTPAEKEAWESAAGGARKVSEWLRGLANAAASPDVFVPSATAVQTREAWTSEMLSDGGLNPLAPKPQKIPSCPRWMHHRPGVYCGSCAK